MSDEYIKRDNVIEKLEFHIPLDLLDDIKNIPAEDVESVVRCKNCINNDKVCGSGVENWCYKRGFNCNPNGFCSEGEE